ncbi:glycoside hydrolase family 2 protein [Mariniflexile sp.]|uniref:glycoside hydrolase family 2 protein n=1 Tax=Mariniflexile sp. TaxID=1979402 RepID=UPI00404814C9
MILICTVLQAQPDENYKSKLTGKIDNQWVISTGNSVPEKQFLWHQKTVPGFQKAGNLRKQAVLAQSWNFYSVDTLGKVSSAKTIEFPHKFEANRNYKSGWYFNKYAINKEDNKRYVIRFDRVQTFSMLYVNGKRVGDHFGGHTPFEYDITDAVVKGDNTMALFVHDESAAVDGDKVYSQLGTTKLISVYNKNGTKDFPGGIKDVPILEIREKTYVKDIFVKTSTRKNELEIEYEINNTAASANSELTFELLTWPEGGKSGPKIPKITVQKLVDKPGHIKVEWLQPKLWSPEHPNLYVLRTTLKTNKNTDVIDTRFGFREFWIDGKSFMLNGKPVRLRGESYYGYPEVTDYNFHKEVFKMQKEIFGVNANRLHAFMPPKEVVLAADEVGILLDNQSAIWSENASYYKNGGEWFLKNMESDFEAWARRDRNSPSVVIWDVENEMLRVSYEQHLPWVKKLDGFIKKFDNTRPFNNSGQGWVNDDQDMVLLHMQEHYSKIMSDWSKRGTKPLIMGEFWVGGRAEQRLPNSPELESVAQRFVEEAKIYEEQMLEMRYREVSGIMPFRISTLSIPDYRNLSSYKFNTPNNLEVKTRSEEVLQKIKHGLQPVTTFFWPRQDYAVKDEPFKRELVVVNDSEQEETFEVVWQWEGGKPNTQSIKLPPAGIKKIEIVDVVPPLATKVIAIVKNKNTVVSSDTLAIDPITISKLDVSKTLLIYKDEDLAKSLTNMGYKTKVSDQVPQLGNNVVWIIPEHTSNRELHVIKEDIYKYLSAGGTLLCLKQDQNPTWFPVKFDFWSANQTSPHTYANLGWDGLNKHLFFSTVAPIYANSHPVFKGLNTKTLSYWDGFDGRVSDDVFSRPSRTNRFEKGNWLPLAGGTRREHVSLAELYYGKGRMLACQLHVPTNLVNGQAKALLINMINYLSGLESKTLERKFAVTGNLDANDIVNLTGVSLESLKSANAEKGDVMLAFDGADISNIKAWANKGGKVVVLSKEISQMFEGIKVESDDSKLYYATKIKDMPLLFGVSSINFLDIEKSSVSGYFSKIPQNAQVVLQGFSSSKANAEKNLTDLWDIEDAGPVMINIPYGKGDIMLSSLQVEKEANPSMQEFLSLLLTNSGVPIPYGQTKPETVTIKKTVPIKIDGKLNEWIEDMEDRYVTQYIHAQPIYLSSENIVEGPPEFDLNLSAINYLLWDEKALYVSGIVFSEEKTFEAGVNLGSKKEYNLNFKYNNDTLEILFKDGKATVYLNGKTFSELKVATGQMDSKNLTDATKLQFSYIQKSGKIASFDNLIGDTFELKIPWELLQSKSSDKQPKAFISLKSRNSKIQVPLEADELSQAKWLPMQIK